MNNCYALNLPEFPHEIYICHCQCWSVPLIFPDKFWLFGFFLECLLIKDVWVDQMFGSDMELFLGEVFVVKNDSFLCLSPHLGGYISVDILEPFVLFRV